MDKFLRLISGLFLMSFLITSCGENSYTQCAKMIKITRQTAKETKELSQDGKTKDIQKVLQVADTFAKASQEMKSLNIQDPDLAKYQAGFTQWYLGMSEVTKDFISALESKNVKGAETAKRQVEILGKSQQSLVKSLNNYCQQNQK